MSKKEQQLNTMEQYHYYKHKQDELRIQRDLIEFEIKNYQDKIIKCFAGVFEYDATEEVKLLESFAVAI